MRASSIAVVLLIALSACGGGGGGDGASPPAPPAQPPPPPPPVTFTISGTVVGLNSAGLVLLNNGGDNFAVAGNSAFTFSTRLATGAGYAVTVGTQPDTQDCAVTNGSGNANANVINIIVACGPMAPLTVTATDPVHHAPDVSRTVRPSTTFSALLAASSGVAALQIESPIDGYTVNVTTALSAPNQLTATPDRKLLPLTSYRVAFGAQGRRGELMPGPAVRRFTTGDATWQDTESPSGNELISVGVQVANDNAGNALAAWRARDIEHGIRVSRYDAAAGAWDKPVLLTGAPGVASLPQLAMDAAGNALLVWQHLNVVNRTVLFAARFSAATHEWEQPRVISHSDTSTAGGVSAVVAPNGDIVVVWKRTDVIAGNVEDSVWMRTSHTLARGDDSWQSPAGPDRVDLPTELSLIYGKPVVALQAGVRFAVAWSRRMNVALAEHVIRVRVFENNQAPVPVVVSDLNGEHEEEPQIAIDRRGDIIVAWRHFAADLNSSVVEARRRTDAGWQPVQFLSEPAGMASPPRLETNRLGLGQADRWVTWVAWVEEGDAMTGRVRVASLERDAIPEPVTLASGSHEQIDSIELAIDPAGNALAVWKDKEADDLVASRYRATTGAWAAPVPIDSEFTSEPDEIGSLAINDAGDIVAAWSAMNDNLVRARRFD